MALTYAMMVLLMCTITCCGEPKGGLLIGRAERIRDDILNRMGCENLEKSEKIVDIAGR